MKYFPSLLFLLCLSLSVGLSLSAQQTASTGIKADTAILPDSVNDYNHILAEALNLQLKSDSLARIAREKRLLVRGTSDEDLKKQLISEMIRLERESKKLQRNADLKFAEAWKMQGNDSLPPQKETTALISVPPVQQVETHVDNVNRDEFSIGKKSIYSGSNPIPKGLVSHKGLIYRIQLGVFSKPRPEEAFGGISPVCYEQVANSSMLKYFAGLFYNLKGVMNALDQVKKNGFPDAFIVAFLDNKPITTERAKEIEFAGMRL